MTEKKLFLAFDFQRFAGNTRLQNVIDTVHRRMEEKELTDDELDQVAAAGIPEAPAKKENGGTPGGSPA